MIKNTEESKPNFYDVYYQESGKKIIVLEGLNVEDIYEAPVLQRIIHEHYSLFELFYWLLLLCVMIYLSGLHIILPLLRKYNLY